MNIQPAQQVPADITHSDQSLCLCHDTPHCPPLVVWTSSPNTTGSLRADMAEPRSWATVAAAKHVPRPRLFPPASFPLLANAFYLSLVGSVDADHEPNFIRFP
jgi:hypothetical protein